MNWEPAHADHAIETVNVIFALTAPIAPDLFDEVLVASRKAAAIHQFTNRAEAIEPFEIQGAPNGEVILNIDVAAQATRRRVGFQRLEAGKPVGEFAVSPSRIILTSSRYSSWTVFKSMAIDLLRPVHEAASVLDIVKSVQLQYVDRSSSTILQADAFEVIKKSSSFIVPAVSDKTLALHSHAGWFEQIDDTKRRLTNVNIDLIDNSLRIGPPVAMSRLGILTMARIDALQQGALFDPLNELDGLHFYLKYLFEDIITIEAAQRVSLND